MAWDPKSPRWIQFRRLLLGTLVEVLVNNKIDLALDTVTIGFDRESDFRVPRFDNYMRFKGTFSAMLRKAVDAATLELVRCELSSSWDDLLAAVTIPIGDRMKVTRRDVRLSQTEDHYLRIAFDLEAD